MPFLGFSEIVIILVLALVLLGPKRLPDVAKQLGKGLREFKKATDDLKSQFEREFYADEVKKTHPNVVAPPTAAAPVQAPPPAPAPAATADNVPGLDAALFETVAPPPAGQQPPSPAAPPPSRPT
ncbi:MAG TPA: Sec-independent protein translocase protein TatB [Anaeromyxobacteraceae bacterium]|nr:Sec-independent protein translocase protein TatB [Anaeromyxobacteraceae bacterium]